MGVFRTDGLYSTQTSEREASKSLNPVLDGPDLDGDASRFLIKTVLAGHLAEVRWLDWSPLEPI